MFCNGLERGAFSGYEVELFNRASKIMGWTPEMIAWECILDYDRTMVLLQQGSCDIVLAGLPLRDTSGDDVTFSWPINRSALKIVIKPRQANYGYFSFFKPFDWLVWLMFVVTGIGAGFLAWGLEWYQLTRGPTAQLAPEYMVDSYDSSVKSTYVWNLVGLPLSVGYIDAKTSAGFAVYLGWGILWMVLIIYYFASIAANMTANLIQSNIQTVKDLQGRKVATWTGYISTLSDYGVNAVGLPWVDKESEMAMFDAVRSGEYDALVIDGVLASHYAVPDCQLDVLQPQFELYDQSVGFRPGLENSRLLYVFNKAILKLIEDGDQEELIATYMNPLASECNVSANVSTLTFKDVAGLWIILAIVTVCCFLYVLIKQLYSRQLSIKRRHHREKTDMSEGKQLNGDHTA